MPKTILITGANGRIGAALVEYIDALDEVYDLRLVDLNVSDARGMKIYFS
jgi:nucleoside-diphosphate-sugar epimerase